MNVKAGDVAKIIDHSDNHGRIVQVDKRYIGRASPPNGAPAWSCTALQPLYAYKYHTDIRVLIRPGTTVAILDRDLRPFNPPDEESTTTNSKELEYVAP